MFRRNREKEAGPAIIEHEFGNGTVRETLGSEDIYGGNEVEVEFFGKGGERYSLNEKLPDGFSIYRYKDSEGFGDPGASPKIFRKGAVSYGDFLRPVVVMRDEFTGQRETGAGFKRPFWNRGGALALLHEVGHTHRYMEFSRREMIRRSWKHYRYHRRSERAEHPEEVIRSPKELESFLEVILADERAAWAWALNAYRNAKHNGIDLAPGMNRKEVLALAHEHLATYEESAKAYVGKGQWQDFLKKLEKAIEEDVDELLRESHINELLRESHRTSRAMPKKKNRN